MSSFVIRELDSRVIITAKNNYTSIPFKTAPGGYSHQSHIKGSQKSHENLLPFPFLSLYTTPVDKSTTLRKKGLRLDLG
jgi:hypothetical protein